MDLDDLRTILRRTGADLWDLIDGSLSLAAHDHPTELRARRDGIVERLYSAPSAERDDLRDKDTTKAAASPSTPQSANRDEEENVEVQVEDEEEEEPAVRYPRNRNPSLYNDVEVEEEEEEEEEEDGSDEQTKILAIKEHIEDPDQDEETVVALLQNLADMDITFKALQETDIGRHVNGLRKHPSGEVRRLVKLLVRKWKDLVDDWMKLHSNEASAASIVTDGDSPQQAPAKSSQNGHHVAERGQSPSLPNGSSIPDRNKWDPEPTPKVAAPARTPTPPIKQKPPAPPLPSSAPPKAKEPQKDSLLDPERLASARRRLHENYQEAQNAKKQRTIQVMDIHEIPKKKNAFFPKSKQGKHW